MGKDPIKEFGPRHLTRRAQQESPSPHAPAGADPSRLRRRETGQDGITHKSGADPGQTVLALTLLLSGAVLPVGNVGGRQAHCTEPLRSTEEASRGRMRVVLLLEGCAEGVSIRWR